MINYYIKLKIFTLNLKNEIIYSVDLSKANYNLLSLTIQTFLTSLNYEIKLIIIKN